MKSSNEFVKGVIEVLPERESLLLRAGRILLQLVLSPIWMWLCSIVVIVVCHKPLLAVLSVLGEASPANIVFGAAGLISFVTFISVQMVRDCR